MGDFVLTLDCARAHPRAAGRGQPAGGHLGHPDQQRPRAGRPPGHGGPLARPPRPRRRPRRAAASHPPLRTGEPKGSDSHLTYNLDKSLDNL